MSKLIAEELIIMEFSDEELGIIQMALMRGITSPNQYFKERCERLLHKILDRMARE